MEMLKHTPMVVKVQFFDETYGGALHTVEFGNVSMVSKNGEDLVVTSADFTTGMTSDHVFTKDHLVFVDIQMGQIKVEESNGGIF